MLNVSWFFLMLVSSHPLYNVHGVSGDCLYSLVRKFLVIVQRMFVLPHVLVCAATLSFYAPGRGQHSLEHAFAGRSTPPQPLAWLHQPLVLPQWPAHSLVFHLHKHDQLLVFGEHMRATCAELVAAYWDLKKHWLLPCQYPAGVKQQPRLLILDTVVPYQRSQYSLVGNQLLAGR